MSRIVEARFNTIRQFADEFIPQRIGNFVLGRDQGELGVPFILSSTREEFANYTVLHNRRVASMLNWLDSKNFQTIDSFTLGGREAEGTYQVGSRHERGLHFDYQKLSWGFNIHTTLEGSGHVFMSRYTGRADTDYSPVAPKSLKESWPRVVDEDVADSLIWEADLIAGDTLVFPVWNESPPGPVGMWHEFTSDDDGRIAIIKNLSFSKSRYQKLAAQALGLQVLAETR